MPEDRKNPPEGYEVEWTDNTNDREVHIEARAILPMYVDTDGAVAACWAHRDKLFAEFRQIQDERAVRAQGEIDLIYRIARGDK